jgi:hypothetical protein
MEAPELDDKLTKSESGFLTVMYLLFRDKLLLIVERLRYFYLHDLNKGRTLHCPPGWGVVSPRLKDLMKTKAYTNAIEPLLDATYKEKYKWHHLYKSELNQRLNINDVAL